MFIWKCIVYCIAFLFALSSAQSCFQEETYIYKTSEFEVPVDHFNFVLNKTFKMRYLYNDSFVDPNSDVTPLFLYTGNESDIEVYADSAGFMWELAMELKAYVVFAEHRYYGSSLPFGDSTFDDPENLGYLSVEQVLEDFGLLIRYLRNGRPIPVIAFGGSYGAMLAAWIRMKFPHLVEGALSASGPVWQFTGLTPCDTFLKIVTSVFSTALNSNCSLNIRDSWPILKNLSTTDDGRKQLNAIFNFCDPLQDSNDYQKFESYLQDVYINLAVVNYPYPSDFLTPLPAYPVREFCRYLNQSYSGDDLVDALQRALQVYSNYTGENACLTLNAYGPNQDDPSWAIQKCNQIIMPMCSKDTMFLDSEWDFQAVSDECYRKYKVRPKANDITFRYGGHDIRYVSNIIFSNGLLDPWAGGGVLYSNNDKISVITIPDGAHHLDLRSSRPDDPISVIEVREQEKAIISQWISNY